MTVDMRVTSLAVFSSLMTLLNVGNGVTLFMTLLRLDKDRTKLFMNLVRLRLNIHRTRSLSLLHRSLGIRLWLLWIGLWVGLWSKLGTRSVVGSRAWCSRGRWIEHDLVPLLRPVQVLGYGRIEFLGFAQSSSSTNIQFFGQRSIQIHTLVQAGVSRDIVFHILRINFVLAPEEVKEFGKL